VCGQKMLSRVKIGDSGNVIEVVDFVGRNFDIVRLVVELFQ